MPDDDEVNARLRKLSVEHAETRWLCLRLDDDVKEIRASQRAARETQLLQTEALSSHTAILTEHTARFESIERTLDRHSELLGEHSELLAEHTARFDSVDMQLRSLTQLVGQVLDRLPEQRADGS